jgi:HSP20 family protein
MPRRDVEEWFWLPGEEMHRLAEEMSARRPKLAAGRGAWEPRVDLIEEEHRFLLKVEIAGVRGEDIQLLYLPERHSLVLRGVREEDDFSDGSRAGVHQLEIFYGQFQREVRLPEISIDAKGIRATYRNGFLLVMIPKQDRVIVSRTIQIRKV